MTLVCALFLFPLYWLVGISLKTRPEIFAQPPLWIWTPTVEHYRAVLQLAPKAVIAAQGTSTTDFLRCFSNSMIIASASVLVSLVLGVPAGYAFARYGFRGSNTLLYSLLLLRMLPPVTVLIPMFVLFRYLRLLDTHVGMVLAYTTFSLPFVVWVMRGFFQDLPRELEESALTEGCTRFSAFWRVILPLARPGLAASAIFALIMAWNDFLFAAVLTSRRTQTLPVLMAGFTSDTGIAWGEMAASGILVILPAIVFSFFTQRHLVAGLSSGAVKG
jgi:ABC-type glycerol-3-phosphate transport system permease component